MADKTAILDGLTQQTMDTPTGDFPCVSAADPHLTMGIAPNCPSRPQGVSKEKMTANFAYTLSSIANKYATKEELAAVKDELEDEIESAEARIDALEEHTHDSVISNDDLSQNSYTLCLSEPII